MEYGVLIAVIAIVAAWLLGRRSQPVMRSQGKREVLEPGRLLAEQESQIVYDFSDFMGKDITKADAFYDVSVLPHPKEAILTAIEHEILREPSDVRLEWLTVGPLFLCQFQEGIGPKPLFWLGSDLAELQRSTPDIKERMKIVVNNPDAKRVEQYMALQKTESEQVTARMDAAVRLRNARLGRRPNESMGTRLSRYDLEGQPFTKALLLCVAHDGPKYQEQFKDSLGSLPTGKPPKNLEEEVHSAACVLAQLITRKACLRTIGHSEFLLETPLGSEARMAVLFGYSILASLRRLLKTEGHEFNLQDAATDFIIGQFLFRSGDERVALFKRGVDDFQYAAKSGEPKFVKWLNDLSQIVEIFIMRFMDGIKTPEGGDFDAFFGSLLKSLLATVD